MPSCLGLLQESPSDAEVDRARRLVGNGYRFSLEAPSAVAAMVGNSALWGREHNLQSPLDWLDEWDGRRLGQELVPQLQPQRAFVLEAVPA